MFTKFALLGRGSQAIVHLAVPANGPCTRCFAVKSSPVTSSFSLEKERRVYSEFLDCPEIVHCFGHYLSQEEGTNVYNLVLEYACTGSLLNLMEGYDGRRVPEDDVREFSRMLLRGLSRIHARGYVHCDLKPDNVMVFEEMDSNGNSFKQIKIADFGLAKEPDRGENPCPGTFRGNPCYMSPESVELGHIDAKLDIWSLGCVIIQMVTGQEVYASITDMDDLFCKLVILKEAPEIPENLCVAGKDFLKRCLAIAPEERWSAAELLEHPFVVLSDN